MNSTLREIMSKPLAYNPENKALFHKETKKALRALAQALGLKPGQYDIRSNQGGVAVSGEVMLHTDKAVRFDLNDTDYTEVVLYIQVTKSVLGPGREVMFRTCSGRNDYTGDRNYFAGVDLLENPKSLVNAMALALVGRVRDDEDDGPRP